MTDAAKKLRVLVVDDEAAIRELAAAALGPFFDVEGAGTLEGGIDRLKLEPLVNAVVLDMVLPNGRGLDVVRHFQRSAPKVPVVAISGYDFPVSEVIGAGAQEFLVKPFGSRELLEALARAIARHRVRPDYRPLEALVQAFKADAATEPAVTSTQKPDSSWKKNTPPAMPPAEGK